MRYALLALFVSLLPALAACDLATSAAATTAAAPAAPPQIKMVSVDGKDVAAALGMKIWAFDCTLPKDLYNIELRVETWTRGAPQPTSHRLLQTGGESTGGRLVVKLGTARDDPCYVSFNASSVSAKWPIDASKYSTTILDVNAASRAVALGEEITLLTLCENGEKAYDFTGGPPTQFDAALQVKLRISKGAAKP